MSQSDQQSYVPRLRFSEFEDRGGWSRVPFAEAVTPSIRAVEKPESTYTGLGVRNRGKGTFLKPDQDPKKIAMDTLYEVHADDLIVSITFAWEGSIAIALAEDQGALVSHRFPTYEFNSRVTSAPFFKYVILDKQLVYQLGVISPGGAGRNRVLNKTDFLALSAYLPQLDEQKKISACLGSLDELTLAETTKLDALIDHKSGLMQSLFPRGGSTTPDFRFPEFKDSPNWEATTIGEIGSFYYGKSAPKWSLSEDAPTPCVRYGELYSTFDTVITETFSRTNIDPKNLKFSKGGEVLVPRVGENPLDFANCCYLPLPNIAIGEMISVFETSELGIFYAYYFRTLREEFARVVEGKNVKNLYYVYLEPIAVGRPSKPEQQRIVECLVAVDEEIEAQKRKLDGLEDHRNGMIQSLLPENTFEAS